MTSVAFSKLPSTPHLSPFRHTLFRFFHCPCNIYIDPKLPILGNRSLFEIIVLFVSLIILFALCYGLQNSESVGSLADKLGALMLLLAMRKMNIITCTIGVSFEHCLFYHRCIAIFTLLAVFIHGCREWQWNNTSGVMSAILMLLIACSYGFTLISNGSYFNSFYFTHTILFTVCIPILAIHGAGFFAFVGLIWLFDIFSRYGLHNQIVTAKIQLIAKKCIRIEFPMLYEMTLPGQYCFLMIKNINSYEYHPFSIASANHQSNNLFYVQVIESASQQQQAIGGSASEKVVHTSPTRSSITGRRDTNNMTWTEHLRKLCLTVDSGDKGIGEGIVEMYVEGPYGSLSIDLMDHDQYPVLLLVAGGMGITPMLGLVNHLLHQFQKGCSDNLQKVFIIWSVKDRETADALYRDYLQPIVEDSEEIHQSTIQSSMMAFSPFHYDNAVLSGAVGSPAKGGMNQPIGADGSAYVPAGVINVPKKGVFNFHLHLTGQGLTVEDVSHKGMLHHHLWKCGRPNLDGLFTEAGNLCVSLSPSVSASVSPKTLSPSTSTATLSPLHGTAAAISTATPAAGPPSVKLPTATATGVSPTAIAALNRSSSGSSHGTLRTQRSFGKLPVPTTITALPGPMGSSRYARRVGVMVAGPVSLREDVRALCHKRRDLFDLHEESFSF